MRTVLVTGGTGGLGSVVVPRLERDYRCVLLGRAELADEASLRAALAPIEALYAMVHLAGGWAGGKVSGTSRETWEQMIDMNLTLAFMVIRATLERMRRDAPARIIAVSSIATLTRSADSAAYVVAKTGLNTLIQATAAELAGTPITANAVLPGTLDDTLRARVADTIAFLLSDEASHVSGALIPMPA